jgi:nucleoside-diphosphate-sugar epimerase
VAIKTGPLEDMGIMKTILLLGANGFIGKNLNEHLKIFPEKYEVDSPPSDQFDASSEEIVKKWLENKYYDVVIHSAVYNPRVGEKKDASSELDKNLRMYFNFERYQDLFGKMLYFGSGAEYDKRGDIKSVKEGDSGNGIPHNDYGLYKYIINKSISSSQNIINLRVFGLFGKYENWKNTFISGACCKAIKNLPITIRQDVYFDYLYINDFCKIVKWFIDNDAKFKDYNVTSGERITLKSIASMVIEIKGKDIPVYVAKGGVAKEYAADNSQLLSEIGRFQYNEMKDSIRDLYEYYQDVQDEIDIYSLLYLNG